MNKPTAVFLTIQSIPFTVFIYQYCGTDLIDYPTYVMWTLRGIFIFLEIMILLGCGYALVSHKEGNV